MDSKLMRDEQKKKSEGGYLQSREDTIQTDILNICSGRGIILDS